MFPNWRSAFYRFLPPATKLGQGNIFSSVCQKFCSQGGYLPIACWDTTPERDTPWQERHPPAKETPHNACWDTVNKRAVSILLECILFIVYSHHEKAEAKVFFHFGHLFFILFTCSLIFFSFVPFSLGVNRSLHFGKKIQFYACPFSTKWTLFTRSIQFFAKLFKLFFSS